MRESGSRIVHRFIPFALTFVLLFLGAAPAPAEEYAALAGLKGLQTVFDYRLGSPEAAIHVFPAMRGVYQDKSVTSLPTPPRTVIVFRGEAVKLLSTARQGDQKDSQARERVAEMIRQFKKDGVRLEVCMYAVKVVGVDPATLMPEVEKVGNGFISVAGYQAQGYSVVVP